MLSREDITKRFIAGKIDLAAAMKKLNASKATVYRYASILTKGADKIIDRRKFGNNRKYGKVTKRA